MASRRELKKNVNYIAGELFMECLVNSLYVPGTDKTKADELMGRILSVQDEFISRISHTFSHWQHIASGTNQPYRTRKCKRFLQEIPRRL